MSLRDMYREVGEDPLPEELELTMRWADRESLIRWQKLRFRSGSAEAGLRYGDNPGNPAALYRQVPVDGQDGSAGRRELAGAVSSAAVLLQGDKHPGMTNLTDIDAATLVLRFFTEPCAAVMKHGNPSGVARGGSLLESLQRAWSADPRAAFGGALVCNRAVDREAAGWLSERYLEVIAAPDFDDGALEALSARKNLRVFRVAALADSRHLCGRRLDLQSLVDGGMVVQIHAEPRVMRTEDFVNASAMRKDGQRVAVNRSPSPAELDDLLFGWFVQHGVTSNSVLYCRDGVTLGISTGEQDRVGSAEIAALKAEIRARERISLEAHGCEFADLSDPEARAQIQDRAARVLEGAVMVSDGFFPMPDGVEVGLRLGVSAIAQPGGSIRDADVIDAVNRSGASMLFTGERLFRH